MPACHTSARVGRSQQINLDAKQSLQLNLWAAQVKQRCTG